MPANHDTTIRLMLTLLQLDALETHVEIPSCVTAANAQLPRSRVNVVLEETELNQLQAAISESLESVSGSARKHLKAVAKKIERCQASLIESEHDYAELCVQIRAHASKLLLTKGDLGGEFDTFLRRRVERLISDLAKNRLSFSEQVPILELAEIERQLKAVTRNSQGSIMVDSCGPIIRAMAHSLRMVETLPEPVAKGLSNTTSPEIAIPLIQRKLFSILHEFINRATGQPHTRFDDVEDFQSFLRENAEAFAKRSWLAFKDTIDSLQEFYGTHHRELYQMPKKLGGVKLVLGGSTNFSMTHLDCVRKTLLYADTILIPDPILPWIEVEREHERFNRVQILRNAFCLLKLKPLIDAELPTPAICVFPSWEKSLENNDDVTKDGMSQILLNFFSFFLDASFHDESEIIGFAKEREEVFLRKVEQHSLFVAPGGNPGTHLTESLRKYREYIQQHRTAEFSNAINAMPDSLVAFNAIWERLAPQFHLRDAETLLAHPLVGIPTQSHYFSLCAKVNKGVLFGQDLLKPNTIETLDALNQSEHRWLGNVPIDSLVQLRIENQNLEFRKRLDGFLTEMNNVAIDDLDRVAAEVSRGLGAMIFEHQKDLKRIQEEFSRRHKKTAVGSWATLAGQFIPLLAPIAPLFAAPSIGKYVWDKIDESSERRKALNSLVGVLATARRNNKT